MALLFHKHAHGNGTNWQRAFLDFAFVFYPMHVDDVRRVVNASYLRTDQVEGWEERIMERGGTHAVFAGRGISQEHPYHCQLIDTVRGRSWERSHGTAIQGPRSERVPWGSGAS